MSLYDRLDLTRPNRKKLRSDLRSKIPIWERIDLTRPAKSKCRVCRQRIQASWRICPHCGRVIQNQKSSSSHCIWIQIGNLAIDGDLSKLWSEILADALSKVFSAFRSVNVFLTTETPNVREHDEDLTQVFILGAQRDILVDYLGVASFKKGTVTKVAIVRIDKICQASYVAKLSLNQLSNLIANTIAHEIAHTLGLDHSDSDTDVMHDGLDYRVHSLMPPSFYAEQIALMNYAIEQHKASC